MKPRLGDWVIGRTNVVLAGVQGLLWIQTGSRGLDYVQDRPRSATSAVLSSIEAALPLTVWGAGFLIAAGILFVGITGRWWTVIVAGHIAAAVMYFCFTAGTWMEIPIRSWVLAVGGSLVLAAGAYLAAVQWRRDWLRFWLSNLTVGVGGWVAGYGMGYNFRTTTGFLVACLGHLMFAIGIAWIATRDRQVREVVG